MLVVRLFGQMGIEYLHHRYYGTDLLIAFLAVGYLLDVFYHFLDVPSVFRHYQFLSIRVVIHLRSRAC